MRLVARVPATVANLGPGFDSFALALELFNEISVDTGEAPSVSVRGEGEAELPTDDSNLVVRSMQYLAREAGRSLPPSALSCENGVPVERGLGSSAAAVVGGLALADRLLQTDLPPEGLLEMAVRLEGHADNAAAALLGGAVIAFESDGGWAAERLEPSAALSPVVLIPQQERVSTEEARRALADQVPRIDATFNVSRAALLALALTSRPDLLEVALQDRLHQEARLELAPIARALFHELRSSGVPVCVAGSGPTLLAFEAGQAVPDPGPGWRVERRKVSKEGVSVLEGGGNGR